jgi:hypothetical protein
MSWPISTAPAPTWHFRRGWTHGIPAVIVLPFLLAGAVLLLAAVSALTHPILDTLNTYGVRWLMPFSARRRFSPCASRLPVRANSVPNSRSDSSQRSRGCGPGKIDLLNDPFSIGLLRGAPYCTFSSAPGWSTIDRGMIDFWTLPHNRFTPAQPADLSCLTGSTETQGPCTNRESFPSTTLR